MAEFEIFEMAVGGGVLALSPLPGRTRHYATDLARLLDWRPALVMTMCETHELERKGSGSLGADMAAHGIAWRHLPLPDYAAPGAELAGWAEASGLALGLLAARRRVLVHCFGGCGRSGMAVLRLMVEAGEDGAAALARLRQARPCAVETDAQLAWALAGREVG